MVEKDLERLTNKNLIHQKYNAIKKELIKHQLLFY